MNKRSLAVPVVVRSRGELVAVLARNGLTDVSVEEAVGCLECRPYPVTVYEVPRWLVRRVLAREPALGEVESEDLSQQTLVAVSMGMLCLGVERLVPVFWMLPDVRAAVLKASEGDVS